MPKNNLAISLISGSSGTPKLVIAKRKSRCKKCGKEIINGEKCCDIPKIGSGFSSVRRFCLECFKRIIERTELDIKKIKEKLG